MTTPAILDESAALWAARAVAPTLRCSPADIAALRAAVLEDLPAVDAAARSWSQLGRDLPPTQARVVGRIGWVRANLEALRGTFDPLAEKMTRRGPAQRKVLGAQIGALLGMLSGKVLGQFVLPFGGPGGGELVLVGPNLLALAAEHRDLADDMRRAVLLHEVVHRLQFDAVDWLGAHLRSLITRYLEHARLDPGVLVEAAGRLPDAIAQVRRTGSLQPLVEAVLTPEQAAVISEAQGLMSLLEGHGTAAMYGSGAASVVEDIDSVRDALQRRRDDVTTRILTAVAGLEMKKRQYREGERFVAAVVEARGIAGLNRAFEGPEHLPSPEEVRDPDTWLARVDAAA